MCFIWNANIFCVLIYFWNEIYIFYIFIYIFLCKKIIFQYKIFFSANNVYFVKNRYFFKNNFFFNFFQQMDNHIFILNIFATYLPLKLIAFTVHIFSIRKLSFSGKYIAKMLSIKIWLFICFKTKLKKKLFFWKNICVFYKTHIICRKKKF